MTTFVALGDSITVGIGDPAPGGGWRGWAALLAGTVPEPEVHNLARLGALAADVERVQLPAAMTLRPDVATVVVGINDTLRGDFDPERTGASVTRTVAALRVLPGRPRPRPGAVQPAADQAGRGRLDGHQGHRLAGPAVQGPGAGPGGSGGARVAGW